MSALSLEEAVEESHAALGATGSGDIEPFMALYSDGDDITFGNPFEPFVRGKEAVREAAERLRAKVGGSDSPASIALRATSVFREENGIRRLVHRHADPITTPQAAESVIGD